VEFGRWLDDASKRLAELYKAAPSQLATNPGSAEHHLMKCKPCIFNQKASGCKDGENCNHCHVCDKDIFRFKEKSKVKIGKRIRKLADGGSRNSEISDLLEWMVTFVCQLPNSFSNFHLRLFLKSKDILIAYMTMVAVLAIFAPARFLVEYAWFAFHQVVFR
jgi:hypothetical protein